MDMSVLHVDADLVAGADVAVGDCRPDRDLLDYVVRDMLGIGFQSFGIVDYPFHPFGRYDIAAATLRLDHLVIDKLAYVFRDRLRSNP